MTFKLISNPESIYAATTKNSVRAGFFLIAAAHHSFFDHVFFDALRLAGPYGIDACCNYCNYGEHVQWL